VHNGALVKTTRFSDPKYVGDPLNAVRIFNEKRADELMVLDIDATAQGRDPNYNLIATLARECRMPLCYGGGVTTPEQVDRIVSLGVEKVAIATAAFSNPTLVESSASRVGSQSIAVVFETRRDALGKPVTVCTHRGTRRIHGSACALARQAAEAGAGEVVINSIDRDGTMSGYDEPLVAELRACVSLPITAIGGASSVKEMLDLTRRHQGVAAAAGSLFVFKGKYRAVLIQYPTLSERETQARD
jgi:cyclase